MSNIKRLSKYARAIRVFLQNKGFDVSGIGSKPNKIMVEFLKSKGLKYEKWNYNYRGLYTAELVNAGVIQDNWDEFKEWVRLKTEL